MSDKRFFDPKKEGMDLETYEKLDPEERINVYQTLSKKVFTSLSKYLDTFWNENPTIVAVVVTDGTLISYENHDTLFDEVEKIGNDRNAITFVYMRPAVVEPTDVKDPRW